jgi:hypothetical protein
MQPQQGFSPPPSYGPQGGQGYQPLAAMGGGMNQMGQPGMGQMPMSGMQGMGMGGMGMGGIPPTQQQGLQGMQMWGVNDATAAMGMQFGQSAIQAGQSYIDKNVRVLSPSTIRMSYPREESGTQAHILTASAARNPHPPSPHPASIQRLQLVRPAQAPTARIPLAAPAVGAQAAQERYRRGRGWVAAAEGGRERA